MEVLKDAILAVKLACSPSLLRPWLILPPSLLLVLAFVLSVDVLQKQIHVSFPASVTCLILLFILLLLGEWALGRKKMTKVVALIDVPAGWSLRWINIFFTPSFVLLPLSPAIGIVDVLKIIAIFVVGFFVMMATAAYMTRALQLLLGSSKREQTLTRTGEDDVQEIPLRENATSEEQTPASSRPQSPPALYLQGRHQEEISPRDESEVTAPLPEQAPLPTERSIRYAAFLSANFGSLIYALIFLLLGLPLYYTTSFAAAAHLCLNVLAYFAALILPASWRTYLHPVLVSSLLTVLGVWTLAVTKGDSLHNALHEYKTGTTYTNFWYADRPLPGAADILTSLLNISIPSLALPIFQHRLSLVTHPLPLLIPSLVIAFLSLLIYPPLCGPGVIGLSPERSLSFASRSLTLALALPSTENLGGDVNLVAALAIVSGILGVLCGPQLLSFLKIPEDDYVTRGVTLGINSSAIATALLLRTDPRAAAMSSLSMTIFGTGMVLFTSIPPVVDLVRSFVGLS